MNNEQTIGFSTLNQQYRKVEHSSGLTLLLCPMEGFSTAYALFAAKVGSIDTTFKTQNDPDFVTVPSGIAHFLEHKMFESEEGDDFAKYAAIGASANAYTSFDRTAYLFSCTGNFRQAMEILMKQVTTPYFTPKTVEKEQGIIGQEIKMYEDDPGWRVMFNLLAALYHNNSIREDIAGTVESISHITADLLHRCHRTFYNLGNMVLAVAGNFEETDVLELADQLLKPSEPIHIDWKHTPEPREGKEALVQQSLAVSTPIFEAGFKGLAGDSQRNLQGQVIGEIVLEMICGESSPLYRRLYDSGLINSTFEYEVLAGRDYLTSMFGGESKNPREVYRQLCQEVARLRKDGFDAAAFDRCRKATYGRYIGMYEKPSSVASLMVLTHFSGMADIYGLLELVRGLTPEALSQWFMENCNPEYSALSIVNPM